MKRLLELVSMMVRAILAKKEVLDIDESALYCGISKSRLYQATSCQELNHYKQFGKVYFRRLDLEKWLTSKLIKSE